MISFLVGFLAGLIAPVMAARLGAGRLLCLCARKRDRPPARETADVELQQALSVALWRSRAGKPRGQA